MGLQIFPASGGTASYAGVFIPISDLANGGIQSDAEFASGVNAATKRDKAVLAFLEVLTKYIADLTDDLKLGVSVSRPNTQSLTWTYGFTYQAYELRNGTDPLSPLPAPSSGVNNGKGEIALKDIFPNATKVANSASISGAGMLIETAPLTRQGAPAHSALDLEGDCRSWMNGFFRWAGSDSVALPVRSTTAASAIIAKTVSTPTTFSLPAAATATTNPTTDLSADDLDIMVTIQFATSLSINLILSSIASQSWDVNSVSA